MTTRIILAAVLGAIAMFIWMFVAHMVLPLGEAGISELPNETTVLDALQTNIGNKPGMYMFPGLGVKPDATRQEMKEAMERMPEKVAKSPSGLLVYYPAGSRQIRFGRWLGIEFLTELAESLLVVFLLAQSRLVGTGARIGFATIVGIVAAISTNVPYWNWYGFPTVYTLSYITTQVIGFVCLGIVAALVLPRNVPGATG
jgi:hypothetical protein